MANVNAPRGFFLVDSLNGADVSSVQSYPVAVGNGTAIFAGDPLTAVNDGTFVPSLAGDGIKVAAVAVGFATSNGRALLYLPASTAGTVIGLPVRGNIFGVQVDESLAATDVSATADFVVGTGNVNTGVSAYQLDSSDIGTGQQLRILGKLDTPTNAYGTNCIAKVQFVENLYENNTSV